MKAAREEFETDEGAGEVHREAWSVKQTATYLNVSVDWVYRHCVDKKIPAFRVGGRWRVDAESVRSWYRNIRPSSTQPVRI